MLGLEGARRIVAIKLVAKGRHSECIPLLEQCVEVFEVELPADSSHTLQVVSRLMVAYKADGNRAQTKMND